jgi:predicted dienelactone hydrolase
VTGNPKQHARVRPPMWCTDRRPLLRGLVALLALLTGAAVAENRIDRIRPDAPELAAHGPRTIGVRTLSFVNPGQPDIARARPGEPVPVADRPLVVELWYPALAQPVAGSVPGEYRVMARDPKTTVRLMGRALRDAPPDAQGGPFPLVIVSHGYPGNRFLMSPLAENLASKGYVVAAIDHTDSTYADQGAFASTLANRGPDQRFVLHALHELGQGGLKGLIDTGRTALVGYSMGGYGVLHTLGGVPSRQPALPAEPRIRAAIVIAPWGWNTGVWNAAGLAGIRTPMLFMAGSQDTVSGYAPGVRNLFEQSVNAPRHLLTFDNAGHNAAAPMPAPVETWTPVPHLPVVPAAHYLDAVWDTVRMNNIAQHFATAFLGLHLRGDEAMRAYLGPPAADGRWPGFAPRNAVGLRLESLRPE